MEKLRAKIKLPDGSKVYVPTIRGKHRIALFKKASDAQTHSERVRARYRRLQAAESNLLVAQLNIPTSHTTGDEYQASVADAT